jgi:hypothetical protein
MLQAQNHKLLPQRGLATPGVGSYSTPFCHADEAWFWAVGALQARRDGCRSATSTRVERPCDPDDVVICVEQLYQNGVINHIHTRVLAKWGARRLAPSERHAAEAQEARIWREALDRVERSLCERGIVTWRDGIK